MASVSSASTSASLQSKLRRNRKIEDNASEDSKDPALQVATRGKNFARYLGRFAVRRQPITRLMQGPWPLGYLGIFSVVDVIGRLIRVGFQAKSASTLSGAEAVSRVFDHMSAFLFIGVVICGVFAGTLIKRTMDEKVKYALITTDSERGFLQVLINLVAAALVFGMGLNSARELYGDPDIGCMMHLTNEMLSIVTGALFLFMVALIYAGDLHSVYRPGLLLRMAVGIPFCAVAFFIAWLMSTRVGHEMLVGEEVAASVIDCRQSVAGALDTSDSERFITVVQFIFAVIVIMVLQQERNIVLLSVGDRIMEALANLQHRMVKRTFAIAKVVQRIVPRPLLSRIRLSELDANLAEHE